MRGRRGCFAFFSLPVCVLFRATNIEIFILGRLLICCGPEWWEKGWQDDYKGSGATVFVKQGMELKYPAIQSSRHCPGTVGWRGLETLLMLLRLEKSLTSWIWVLGMLCGTGLVLPERGKQPALAFSWQLNLHGKKQAKEHMQLENESYNFS